MGFNLGFKGLTLNKTDNTCIMSRWGAFLQPLLWWKSSKYYIFRVCVCSLKYPVCNAHVRCFHLWRLRQDTRLQRNVTEHKIYVLIFSTTSVWNIFRHFRKIAKSNYQLHVRPSVCPRGTTPLPLDGFLWNLKLESFQKSFEKFQD